MKGRALLLVVSVLLVSCGGGSDSGDYAVAAAPAPSPGPLAGNVLSNQIQQPRMSTDDIFALLMHQGRAQQERELARREEELGKREANVQRTHSDAETRLTIANSVIAVLGLFGLVGVGDRLLAWFLARRARLTSSSTPPPSVGQTVPRAKRRRMKRSKTP